MKKTKKKEKNSRLWVERYNIEKPSGKPEVIYERYGEFGQINAMMAYGNYIYMNISEIDIFHDTLVIIYKARRRVKWMVMFLVI